MKHFKRKYILRCLSMLLICCFLGSRLAIQTVAVAGDGRAEQEDTDVNSTQSGVELSQSESEVTTIASEGATSKEAVLTTTASSVTLTQTTTAAVSTTQERVKKNGWITKNKKKYYYVDDIKVTGWKKIKKHSYYFNKKGVLQTNKMISKNKYVDKNGILVDKSKIYSYQRQGMKTLKTKLSSMKKKYAGDWSIYVKNLDTNEYLSIHSHVVHPASVIKLYNMGCTYHRIEQGSLKKSSSVKSNLKSMITVSDNNSYNRLLRINGGGSMSRGVSRMNAFCKAQGYKDTTVGGTLHPSYLGAYHRGYNRSSVNDCGHILEDIYRGTLVSEAASKEMLSLLKAQKRRWKIPAGLPKGVKCANKTGETGGEQHDAAIVFSDNADYILVVMTKNDNSSISHIRSISKTVYEYFNK